VARLVLEENDGGFYVRSHPERMGNLDGIETERLNILLQTRDLIWKWNADETIRADENMLLSVALAHDLQRRLEKGNYSEMKLVLERYDTSDVAQRFKNHWNIKNQSEKEETERFLLMSDFMEELSGLETICREWPGLLESCRTILYHSQSSRETYAVKRSDMSKKRPESEQDKRKLFEYFIYSFLLSSLYDGDLLTKVKMAVLCTMAVEELYTVAECHSIEQRAHICHAIARQIENSDENRKQLESFLKQTQFGSKRMINALLEVEE